MSSDSSDDDSRDSRQEYVGDVTDEESDWDHDFEDELEFRTVKMVKVYKFKDSDFPARSYINPKAPTDAAGEWPRLVAVGALFSNDNKSSFKDMDFIYHLFKLLEAGTRAKDEIIQKVSQSYNGLRRIPQSFWQKGVYYNTREDLLAMASVLADIVRSSSDRFPKETQTLFAVAAQLMIAARHRRF